ncbi:hypothetical protein TraAM80_04735 [Trypanosoma rangeli]|uniref:Uncharacterized protein n=1 Tax=Trypanosoma rangeli TaxID=5698 RepID=A0A422NI18_TRYRA|nr:uncharacterized protein TraAM80_04735 [Trypanosoma rangeli]RNF05089.1 hypothetical protein TraAM80_04735 [Trypanosoma rangeli]|eukprot:RNF05089.1 hypothetical protein TraAM80_04735 [Trypanosoma rangeli]
MTSSQTSSFVGGEGLQELRRLLVTYEDAVKELRIPASDRKFYEVCFVSPLRESLSACDGDAVSDKLQHELEGRCFLLASLCRHLEEHRTATVRVLQLCQRRDDLVEDMLRVCALYQANGTLLCPPLPPDSFMAALEEHHRVTLLIVEAIFDWREQLSFPFPFVVSGENYLYRILDDCSLLDASLLGHVLRLRLTEHPLGSHTVHVPDPKRRHGVFMRGGGDLICGEGDGMPVALQGGPSRWRRQCSHSWPHDIHATVKRRHPLERNRNFTEVYLQWAEAVIKKESILQQRLISELVIKAKQGFFTTLLATPDIVRDAGFGLPLLEGCFDVWRERVIGAVNTAAATPTTTTTTTCSSNGDVTKRRRESPVEGHALLQCNGGKPKRVTPNVATP